MLEITTDYLSCLAVNRAIPKDANDQSLTEEFIKRKETNDPIEAEAKSPEQIQRERLETTKKR